MNSEQEQDAKSAKKFLWILMMIPIGLAIGVVTSNVNFREAEESKADLEQFKVSQMFDRSAIEDDMEKILLSKDENADYFLRHISSTLGINHYLTVRSSPGYGANLGYYDIKGRDNERITVVIVELDESNPVAKAALLAVPVAVIKSLAGEKGFSHTLRFVFLPKKYDDNSSNLREKGEDLESYFMIRAGGGFTINDDISWKRGDVWYHPAMAYPHESVSDYITPGQVELSLEAAVQLKELLVAEMQK